MNNSQDLERINKYYYRENESIDIENAEDDCKLLSNDFKNRMEIINNFISSLNNETNVITNNNNTKKKKRNIEEKNIIDHSRNQNKEINIDLLNKKLNLVELINNNINGNDEKIQSIESKKINYIIDLYKTLKIEVQSKIINLNKSMNESSSNNIYLSKDSNSVSIPLSSYSLTLLLREKIDKNISAGHIFSYNNNDVLESNKSTETINEPSTENSVVKSFKIFKLLKLINPYSFDFEDAKFSEDLKDDNVCNNISEQFEMDSEKSNINDNIPSFTNENDNIIDDDEDGVDDYYISILHLSKQTEMKESKYNNDNTKKRIKSSTKININSSKRKIESNIVESKSSIKNIKLDEVNSQSYPQHNKSEFQLIDYNLIHEFNVKNGWYNTIYIYLYLLIEILTSLDLNLQRLAPGATFNLIEADQILTSFNLELLPSILSDFTGLDTFSKYGCKFDNFHDYESPLKSALFNLNVQIPKVINSFSIY
jgi:hypothetical protein